MSRAIEACVDTDLPACEGHLVTCEGRGNSIQISLTLSRGVDLSGWKRDSARAYQLSAQCSYLQKKKIIWRLNNDTKQDNDCISKSLGQTANTGPWGPVLACPKSQKLENSNTFWRVRTRGKLSLTPMQACKVIRLQNHAQVLEQLLCNSPCQRVTLNSFAEQLQQEKMETFVLTFPHPRTSWEKQREVNEGIQIFLGGN